MRDMQRFLSLNSRTLSTISVILILMMPTPLQAERPAEFGKQWVRNHPMTIMGLTQSPRLFKFSQYKAGGMNSLLAWKNHKELMTEVTDNAYPIHVHFNDAKLNDDLKDKIRSLHKHATGPVGILIHDEPKTTEMTGVAEILQWIRREHPETLVYSNAYPKGAGGKKYYGRAPGKPYAYGNYLNDFASIIRPDVLMFDIYPFRGDSGVSSIYFQNLANVREEAQRIGVPYWFFVQSAPTPGARFPSESELRMQVFSSLAYGFTGMAYFTYDLAFERGLLDPDGSPNELYHTATRVNHEVSKIGRSLRFLNSAHVWHIPGHTKQDGQLVDNPLIGGLHGWDKQHGDKWGIDKIRVLEPGENRDVLVGLFTDDAKRRYFMAVNLWSAPNASADMYTTSIEIQFTSEFQTISRLSRETGAAERLTLEKGILKLSLPGGTGDLFAVGDHDFPGQP